MLLPHSACAQQWTSPMHKVINLDRPSAELNSSGHSAKTRVIKTSGVGVKGTFRNPDCHSNLMSALRIGRCQTKDQTRRSCRPSAPCVQGDAGADVVTRSNTNMEQGASQEPTSLAAAAAIPCCSCAMKSCRHRRAQPIA